MNDNMIEKDAIRAVIPHRDPILLADSAKLEGNFCETSFFVSPDMPVFEGHFPDGPVLPGVYIIEAMAQCADILLLSAPENRGKTPLLSSVSQMRFLRPVNPGDTLICHAEILCTEPMVPAASGTSSDSVTTSSMMFDFRVWAAVNEKKAAQGMITLCLK